VRRDGVRCPAGQASLARYSGGAGAPPGSTKRPCQELADDRKAQAKRLRSLLPRRASSARMEGVGSGARIVGGALIGESAARRSAKSPHVSMRLPLLLKRMWRAERRPRGLIEIAIHRIALFGAPPIREEGVLILRGAEGPSRRRRSSKPRCA
jgi:hypothetical protein